MRETESRRKEHDEMLIKKKEKTEELIVKQKAVKWNICRNEIMLMLI